MCNNIFDNFHRKHCQLPVKLQIMLTITASPHCQLILNLNILIWKTWPSQWRLSLLTCYHYLIILKSHLLCKLFYLLFNNNQCTFFIITHDTIPQKFLAILICLNNQMFTLILFIFHINLSFFLIKIR